MGLEPPSEGPTSIGLPSVIPGSRSVEYEGIMAETLYIIDGHSQIYRAYYAPFRDLTSSTGEPTRATYVFCSMLMKFVADRRPALLAMAIDGPSSGQIREGVFADYKLTRSAMPDDLPMQIKRIISIVKALGIPILEAPGYEADDIIATAASRFASPDRHVVAISRDKDLDQILSPYVTMYDPMKDETIDAAGVLAQKGYPPEKAVEVQTLMGDAIDNIPGIPGVGPKTAAKLIMQYGTAEGVVEHASELTPKLRDNVLAHAGNLKIARQLVILEHNVPIELDLEKMRFPGLRASVLRRVFAELGFNRMLDQLDKMQCLADESAHPAAMTPPPPAAKGARRPGKASIGGLFDQAHEQESAGGPDIVAANAAAPAPVKEAPAGRQETAVQEAPAGRQGMVVEDETALPAHPGLTTAADFDYRCIDTLEDLQAVAKELAGVCRLAVDTETTCPQPMWCQLVGISLSWKRCSAVYIPVKGPLGSCVLNLEDVRRIIGPVLADPNVLKIGHNIKYDLISLKTAGMDLSGPFFDTLVAAHVLDSTRMSYALSVLSAELLKHKCLTIDQLIGRGKKQITMDLVACGPVSTHACEDADMALRLADMFEGQLAEQGLTRLFNDLEMPLLPVLAEMEQTGIFVDINVLKRMETQLSAQAQALRERIVLAAGRPFNPDSPRQLAQVLFEDLKLPIARHGKTGASTDSEVLEQLAIVHELPGLVLDYRRLTKLIGTYLASLGTCIHPRTGRVHTDFHQTGAATGRLSSSDPNLQNIPIRSEEGRRIRSAFVADDGFMLMSADYSQVELRVLAHLCQDPTLMAAFQNDQDIHRIVAAEVFGVPIADVTAQQRSRAKTVNFGIIYGQTAYGLSLVLRIPRTEAKDFIERYRRRFPRIEEFLQSCIRFAKANGYVETIFGRRRRIAEISTANPQRRALAERLAINSVVQGSAADLIKQAMVNIARRIKAQGRPSRMLLQIHDELVFEVPQEAIEAEREMVVHEMSSAIKLRVPLKVDVGVGKNWMEAK